MQGTSKLRAAVGVAAPTTVLARVEVSITCQLLPQTLTCSLYDRLRPFNILRNKLR